MSERIVDFSWRQYPDHDGALIDEHLVTYDDGRTIMVRERNGRVVEIVEVKP